MILVPIFVRVVLPVFVVIAMGFAYARLTAADIRHFSRIAWYMVGPCLAFTSLAKSTVNESDFFAILVLAIVVTLAMWPVAALTARGLRLSRSTSSAFQLAVLFGNVVNFGFPVLLFAFGSGGLERGVIFMMGNTLLLSTVAVFIASRGHSTWRQALLNVFRMPMLYASVLGFLVNRAGITIPSFIFEPLRMVGETALMLMLLILGMQLSQVRLSDGRLAIAVATGLRVLGGVAVGTVAAQVIGLQGLSRQAFLVETGTPTAVYAAIIAEEFDVAPGFAAATIFVSTLLSLGTITVLLALLGVR